MPFVSSFDFTVTVMFSDTPLLEFEFGAVISTVGETVSSYSARPLMFSNLVSIQDSYLPNSVLDAGTYTAKLDLIKQNQPDKTVQTSFTVLAHDSDSDGIVDYVDNCPNASNSDQKDSDFDKIGDMCDYDIDNDYLSNEYENLIKTDPLNHDSDGDGSDDRSELIRGTSPFIVDLDSDDDGIINEFEVTKYGTDPQNPDTDGDGLLDGIDSKRANPLKQDADDDGFSDLVDLCPKKPEDLTGYPTDDGCPGIRPNCSDNTFFDTFPQEFITSCDIRGYDFSNKQLSDLIFLRDLTGANFNGARLQNIIFGGSSIADVTFSGAVLDQVKFTTKLSPTTDYDFSHSLLYGVSFASHILSNAKFADSILSNVDFSSARLESADFANTVLSNVNFKSADLHDAQFDNSELNYVDLSSIENTHTSFRNVHFNNVQFGQGSLDGAVIKGASFSCVSPFKNSNPLPGFTLDFEDSYEDNPRASRVFKPYVTVPSNTMIGDQYPAIFPDVTLQTTSCITALSNLPLHPIYGTTQLRAYSNDSPRTWTVIPTTHPTDVFVYATMEFDGQTYTSLDRLTTNPMYSANLWYDRDDNYNLDILFIPNKSTFPLTIGDLNCQSCPGRALGESQLRVVLDNGIALWEYSSELNSILHSPVTVTADDTFQVFIDDEYLDESDAWRFVKEHVVGFVTDIVLNMATGGAYGTYTMILGVAEITGAIPVSSVGDVVSNAFDEDDHIIVGAVYSENYGKVYPVILEEHADGQFYSDPIKVSDITDLPGDRIYVMYQHNHRGVLASLNVSP